MDNKLLNKIPFKIKKQIVSETLLLFAKMTRLKNSEEVFSKGASEIVRERIAGNVRGTSIIEAIFKLLSAEQYMVLENDFIKRLDKDWYVKSWSKGTYYRLKHEAIDQFLYYLYD